MLPTRNIKMPPAAQTALDNLMSWGLWIIMGVVALAAVFGGVGYAYAWFKKHGHDEALGHIVAPVAGALLIGTAPAWAYFILN